MKEYKITFKKGMEGIGEMGLEWLTPKEIRQRWEQYYQYQEKCKKEGTYGQEYEVVIQVEYDPFLDTPIKELNTSFETFMWDTKENNS